VQGLFVGGAYRSPNAARATPTTAVAVPIQIHGGLFDMKDPGITPMPCKAQTIPARAMRTPKMTAIMRMGSRTRRRPLSLGPCRVDPARTAAGLSRRSSRGLRARANSGTIPLSRMEERGTRGIAGVLSRRYEYRAWNP